MEKIFVEKVLGYSKIGAIQEFEETRPDCKIIYISDGKFPEDFYKKACFKIKFKKLKAKFKCFWCENKIFGQPAFVGGKRVCPKRCYFETREKLEKGGLLLK